MALLSTAEMLEEIQKAILAVLAGQSYTVNGQTVTRANLKDLREMEREYKQELAREQSGNSQYLMSFNHD